MSSESGRTRSIEDLVNELRERVETRRRSGAYPAGLEEDLSSHFRRIVGQRRPREWPDIAGPVGRLSATVPFDTARIPLDSQLPAGQVVHKTVARLVARQTEGILHQVREFAAPVADALTALGTSVEQLRRDVDVDMASHVDTLYEHVAAYERALIGSISRLDDLTRRIERLEGAVAFDPWYPSESFEEQFRGGEQELLERYRDVAARLEGQAPVLDFGCGRGEFLLLLDEFGIDSMGVELDGDLVKSATERGLRVEHGDGIEFLRSLDDRMLGGLVLIQVVEHLTQQQILELVLLAARKVRPGGQVLVETVNPQSLYVYAHAFYLDPTHVRPVHPAYLRFLFSEAGFQSVALEWRSPPPEADTLKEVDEDSDVDKQINENVRRLNQLLFAPQDYLVAATR